MNSPYINRLVTCIIFSIILGFTFSLNIIALTTRLQTPNIYLATQQLTQLKENEQLSAFSVKNIYEIEANQPIAIQLVHNKFHFRLYILTIPTVPQAVIWFNTPVKNDWGTSHTLEHLVIGKGLKGKHMRLLMQMELGKTTAGTYNTFTDYSFYTNSGLQSFYKLFYNELITLLTPDFTDQEIAREVFHYGYQKQDNTIQIIEKGTVYNEQINNFGINNYWYGMLSLLFGPHHPAAQIQGGSPSGLRKLKAQTIRNFHRKHYRLNNGLAMITVLDPQEDLHLYVKSLSEIINQVSEQIPPEQKQANHELMPPLTTHTEADKIKIFNFAHKDETENGNIMLAWPPKANLDIIDHILLECLLFGLGGGETSLLYTTLIESQHNSLPTQIGSISVNLNNQVGYDFPIIFFQNIRGDKINNSLLKQIKNIVIRSIDRILTWKDNSPEVIDFNTRIRSYIIAKKRNVKLFLSSPPKFGHRGTYDEWKKSLEFQDRDPLFKKSFFSKELYHHLLSLLATGRNIWKELIKNNQLKRQPFITATKPNRQDFEKKQQAKEERIKYKIASLKKQYQNDNEELVLKQFQLDYDKVTTQMDTMMSQVKRPSFTQNPPLTFDDQIISQDMTLQENLPIKASFFPHASNLGLGLAFSLNKVDPELYPYLSIFPTLLKGIGLKEKEGEKHINFKKLARMLNRDISKLTINIFARPRYHKYYLKFSFSGVGLAEFKKAVNYANRIINNYDLSYSNIDRIRKLVDEKIDSYAGFMLKRGEHWVVNLARNYQQQHSLLTLHVSSNFTIIHDLYRLKWQLKDPLKPAELEALQSDLDSLITEGITKEREQINTWMNKQASKSSGLQKEIFEYLSKRLNELSPNYSQEITYLYNQALTDLQTSPQEVFTKIRRIHQSIFQSNSISGYMVSSKELAHQVLVAARKLDFLHPVNSNPNPNPIANSAVGLIDQNIIQRKALEPNHYPKYIGIALDQLSTGNLVFFAKAPQYTSEKEEDLIKMMSLKLFEGTGPHSLFMQTWQEGLAYGNYTSYSETNGEIFYYADTCPNILSTIKFVKHKTSSNLSQFNDPYYLDYILTNYFNTNHASKGNIVRGNLNWYNDFIGHKPAKIKSFRKRLLKLRSRADTIERVIKALPSTINTVILDRPNDMKRQAKSLFIMIAPISQIKAVEKSITPHPITYVWPADFWSK